MRGEGIAMQTTRTMIPRTSSHRELSARAALGDFAGAFDNAGHGEDGVDAFHLGKQA